MPSPNVGKTGVERAFCIARALTARSPIACDESVALQNALTRLMIDGKYVRDRWFRVIKNNSTRYIIHYSNGGGQSRDTIPDGETIAFEVDIRGQNPVTTEFAKLVNKFVADTVYLKLAFEAPDASSEISTAENIVEKGTRDASRLRHTLEACDPGYSSGKVREFREWLKKTVDHVEVKGHIVPLARPEHLVSFAEHLATIRSLYAADAILHGCIATTIDVCVNVSAEAVTEEPKRFETFARLASDLLAGDGTRPNWIADTVIQRAISMGLIQPLLNLAEQYRAIVQDGIDAAKTCASLDDFLEKLYELVPRALGAVVIYRRLARPENAVHLSSEQAKVAVQNLSKVDENFVRVASGGFTEQILDFEGKQWNIHRHELAEIWRTRGKTAAMQARDDLVSLLAYPEPVAAYLINEAKELKDSQTAATAVAALPTTIAAPPLHIEPI